jgi:Sugar-transfer associated ATP-grasp
MQLVMGFPIVGRFSGLALIVSAVALSLAAVLAQVEFPVWGHSNFSPVELALWIGIFCCLALALRRLMASGSGSRERQYWKLAVMVLATMSALQSADWFMDIRDLALSGDLEAVNFGLNAALAIIVAAWIYRWGRLPKGDPLIEASFALFGAFQLLALISEASEGAHLGLVLTTDFAKLLCIELYAVALILMARPQRPPEFNFGHAGRDVGHNARAAYNGFGLFLSARHPPVRAAFYPGLREAVLLGAVGYLASTSGRVLKRATGKPIAAQVREMTRLWFRHGIDPPSYYQNELYLPERGSEAGQYLTRFETKNGLFKTLNKRIRSPYARNEMNDKAFFAECCRKLDIPHPQSLLEVGEHGIASMISSGDMRVDLFCKQKNGMGASHTHAFRYSGDGRYADMSGGTLDLDGILARLRAERQDYVVQPWLRNAPSIADFAQDSLIAFRVVTMADESGQVEVVLAMLRVLAKLEPKWTQVPDGEYAAPINLETGVLGRLTGDHMSTSHLYYDVHLVTGAQVTGRKIAEWPSIHDAALAAHRAFPHRILVGWDIALTGVGPLILEGNTNFDVMFLQRVHGEPASRSRFGALLNHHLMLLRDERLRARGTPATARTPGP